MCKCNSIRRDCKNGAEIKPGDKYCRQCGRRLANFNICTSEIICHKGENRIPINYKVVGNGILQVKMQSLDPEVKVLPTFPAKGENHFELQFDGSRGTKPIHLQYEANEPDSDSTIEPWQRPSQLEEYTLKVTRNVSELPDFDPQTLYFDPRHQEGSILLWNKGSMDVRVSKIEIEGGFKLVHQSDKNLLVNRQSTCFNPVEIKLSSSMNLDDSSGRVLINFNGLTERIEVELRNRFDQKTDRIPDFYVGIDFGTSGTSVFLRTSAQKLVDEPESLGPATSTNLNPERFPTIIYEGTDDWYFGTKAEEKYMEQRGELRVNEPVTNLKDLLRNNTVNAEDLRIFGWYLRKILEDLVVPAMLRHRDDIERSFSHFVFTTPVFEKPEEKDRYSEILLNAAEKAGFRQYGKCYCIPEPEAAIYELADSKALKIIDGQRVLVFDSGAGTTDYAIATIRRCSGKITLEKLVVSSFTAVVTKVDNAVETKLEPESFGGDFATYLMAHESFLNDFNKSGDRGFLDKDKWKLEILKQRSFQQWTREMTKRSPLDSAKWKFNDRRILNIRKENLNDIESGAKAKDFITSSDYPQVNGSFYKELVPKLSECCKSSAGTLKKFLSEQSDAKYPIDKLILVGGNSTLFSLQDQLRKVCDHQSPKVEFLMTDYKVSSSVVARGATKCTQVLSGDVLPSNIKIEFKADSETQAKKILDKNYPFETIQDFEIQQQLGKEISIFVYAENAKSSSCLAHWEFDPRANGKLTIQTKVEKRLNDIYLELDCNPPIEGQRSSTRIN